MGKGRSKQKKPVGAGVPGAPATRPAAVQQPFGNAFVARSIPKGQRNKSSRGERATASSATGGSSSSGGSTGSVDKPTLDQALAAHRAGRSGRTPVTPAPTKAELDRIARNQWFGLADDATPPTQAEVDELAANQALGTEGRSIVDVESQANYLEELQLQELVDKGDWKALYRLGYDVIEIMRAEGMTDAQIRAAMADVLRAEGYSEEEIEDTLKEMGL